LKNLKPDIKVLFMSGYAQQAAVSNGELSTGAPILEKPFALEALSKKVREILDIDGTDRLT
jgi:hypothetical protein